jgi:hypothetical protein
VANMRWASSGEGPTVDGDEMICVVGRHQEEAEQGMMREKGVQRKEKQRGGVSKTGRTFDPLGHLHNKGQANERMTPTHALPNNDLL